MFKENADYFGEGTSVLEPVADILFDYLRDVIYDQEKASLNPEQLPEEFRDFGKGLLYFSNLVMETKALAKELANGNLHCELPPPGNEIAAPLKMLHASLKHLTWQTQQVANGDYNQHVDFMGDFSDAFNNMTGQLEQRRKIDLDEKSRLERYVDLLLTNCPDPILLFDRKGRLAYASDSYLKRCEISDIDGIFGKQIRELFANVISDEFIGYIENLFKTAEAKKCTAEAEQDIDFGHNGSRRHYHIQVTPMLDTEGSNEGIMVILHDTTEIVHARREAERAREIAEQSSRAKSDFLARMSHEMRTPMNAIIGMTAIYSASDDPERKKYSVEKIGDASRHLLGVINDVLDMSNIESDKFELSYSAFDLNKMIERVAGSVIFRAEERSQRFSVAIDSEVPGIIVADERRLEQVIANLLSNAFKFTGDGGEISLSVKRMPGEGGFLCLRFTVKDNGIGISKEQQERLFVPFEQADGGLSRKYGGTGLGLAISKRIVGLMGGDIWVNSEVGLGSSFIFDIIAEEAQPADHIPARLGAVHNSEAKAGGMDEGVSDDDIFLGRRVLLAEDVEINREVLCALLEHTGISIDPAENGMEALEKFATATPGFYDLILMDIHMPCMDGYETTVRIRRSGLPGADAVPIVAMTANVFREDIERCLASGMSSHLGKPIDPDEVIARLKEYLL